MTLQKASARLGYMNLYKDLQKLSVPDKKAKPELRRSFVRQLRMIMIRHRNIGHDWAFNESQTQKLQEYKNATIFLAQCLSVAQVSNRKAIEETLLLPPGEWQTW